MPLLPRGLIRRTRLALALVRHAPHLIRSEDRCEVAGHSVRVPRGVFHPRLDGSSAFLLRTVGPMVSVDHRVLDVGTGCGIGAVVAASRGADVVACDPDPAAVASAEANLRASGGWDSVDLRAARVQDLGEIGVFDLVWFNGLQDPSGYALMGDLLDACPDLLGERGRLVVSIDRTTGMGEFVRSRVPEGYRVVRLARSLGLAATWEAFSIGWDSEAARARRHADRAPGAKAAVSRKRWERAGDGPANQPPPGEAINS